MCNEPKTVRDVVLRNSGLSEEEFDDAFFNESAHTNLPIKNLDEAAQLIITEAWKGTPIRVIGDYDVDGVCGTSIIYLSVRELSPNVSYRIPKRMSEGYGLKPNIIDEIDEGMIITVDNGIAAYEAIKKAKDKGLKVIVIDHHLLGTNMMPPADVVVDPHVIKYNDDDFEDYCGAGLAYRLACKLIPGHPLLDKLLCYAAIATIADSVPLKRENRFIVKNGLKNMVQKEKRTTGLGALLSVYSLQKYINEKDIAFRIAPAINAPGRLYDDGAKTPVELFINRGTFEECTEIANYLYETNRLRIDMKDKFMAIAHDMINREMLMNSAPIVLASEEFHEGLAGIIAGKITEEYHVPAIVLCLLEDGETYKGSGRSVEDVNLFELVGKFKSKLRTFGGHKMACGLSVKKENLADFIVSLEDEMSGYIPKGFGDAPYDLVIQGTDVDDVMNEVRKYEPYGEGNPEVVFKIENYRLSPKGSSVYETKGADDSTVLLHGMCSSAIGFFMTDDYMKEGQPKNLTIVGTIRDKYKVPLFKPSTSSYTPKKPTSSKRVGNKKEIERETQVEIMTMKKADMPLRKTSLAEMLSQMSQNR